jgi:membrane protein YqaA with SNARE-associated domain
MTGDAALLGAAFAFGIGSALLPVFLNAELYVIGMGAFVPRSLLFLAILSLGIGTVLGKALVFELVRRGSSKVRKTVDRKPPRNRFTALMRQVGDRLLMLLDRPYLGAATVLASAGFGIPPLAVVTILAGASKQPRSLFLLMVFIGRTTQFLAIAFLVHGVT